jgi:tetratricopeptide (TPR) repeat protein
MVNKLQVKEESGSLSSREKRQKSIAERKSETFVKISESIDSKLGSLANCENLIPLYEKNFEEKKTDIKWVKSAVGRMYSKECTEDPLFVKLVEAQNALDPTSDTYFYLGLLKMNARNSQGAVADFNKAVSLETDAKKKANILYKIATIYKKSNKSLSRSYAQKAVNNNASLGKAYLLIASLYADSANECGSTTFEKRAIYWKAAEEAKKAGRVDLALRSRANQTIERYMALAPSKTDIFSSGLAGKTVTFNCWVGGSVSVPSL